MYKNASKLDLTSKAIYKDPLFRVGLLVKIIVVILLVPKIQSEWFTPFMTMTISDLYFIIKHVTKLTKKSQNNKEP